MGSSQIVGLLGILLALGVFTFLSLKGVHTFITCAAGVLVVVLFNGLNLTETFTVSYWPNFTWFISNYWWIGVSGAMFGSVLSVTGGSVVVGRFIMSKFSKNATLAVTVVCTILQFCGITVFGGAIFAVLPMLYTIFKEQDIPRRYAPAIICFSALTLANVTPGTTAMHNLMPANFFGLKLTCGAVVGLICLVVMLVIGQFFLDRSIKRAQAKGEHFVEREGDFPDVKDGEEENYPPLWKVIIAMLAFPLCVNLLPFNLFFSQIIATAIALVVTIGHWRVSDILDGWRQMVPQSIILLLSQAAVMGFGSVFTSTEAYSHVVEALLSIPGTPLISCAVSTTLMAMLCGSASSGINITLNSLGSAWLAQTATIPAAAFSRVCGLSSLVLDSMPYNGAINGLCNTLNCKVGEAYEPIFWVTVVTPAIGTVLMIILFTLFPFLP